MPAQQPEFADLLQTHKSDAFVFTEQERLILELYNQEQELQLESSLFEAQAQGQLQDLSSISDDVLQAQLIKAEREALEERTKYLLRNRIAHNVLVTDPVLKAVHGGANAAFSERRLLPLIKERDVISMVHSSLAAKLSSTLGALATAEKNNLAANEKNKELAQTLFALAEEMKSQSTEEIEDPNLRAQLQELDSRVRMARRRWRIMKSVVAGMVVGSGINWASDATLRELVMDDEDELQ
ncbi:hypothetical protein AOQ84DRAFT_376979 [Glonium stellatum]|uniref:Centromere protein H C-terminal domain-containing protein n=1 Tax=Glonium stellatum TaxID=574774 RepID=A0A8E2F094_9PEZI|nr:hypothetical protein AOQ84DRAFT_376979 [Glonium stellatum]